MTKRGWIVLGGVVLAGVVALGIGLGRDRRTAGNDPDPSATIASPSLAPIATASPPPASSSPTEPPPTATPIPSATPRPPAPARTAKPRATGDPRLTYAEFLLRVNDDRATVDDLNTALTTAGNAQDPDAVRRASVDILDFVDVERDWLQVHPSADCYAAAHAAAGSMLDAYGTAAERFIDWSATGGGIAGLSALGRALDASQAAADGLTTFGRSLEATTCPG